MSKPQKKSRTLFWFYLLVTYIFVQFAWWTYSMVNLNTEVSRLKAEINLLNGASAGEIISKGNELNEKLHARWIMISSEGAVFVGILLLGIFQVRKTFKREILLGQQQKNFLLSVTHELKSPIASAKLQLQTLLKHELDREKQKEVLSNAIGDTDRLNNLVENILLATQIDNDQQSTIREDVNISVFIDELIAHNVATFHIQQEVNVSITPNIRMAIDPTNFTSIILNLFENAVKYSPKQSSINVSLKDLSGSIVFSVADEGVGISDKDKKRVFNKFYRVGNEETRSAKGTGLGLYIVNHFVEQHKGNITVKDNKPKGSVFEIQFNKA